mmetsp:Transcript_9139/g.33518  ORF Transcript_9139/g.33518 Transcript_9139/m.33518 type:complete len:545 (-) Transcript_9139:997-2631(-)|eukprot:scaffold2504_cov405-Prasinococcus_capsulatus_cf.AAC.4
MSAEVSDDAPPSDARSAPTETLRSTTSARVEKANRGLYLRFLLLLPVKSVLMLSFRWIGPYSPWIEDTTGVSEVDVSYIATVNSLLYALSPSLASLPVFQRFGHAKAFLVASGLSGVLLLVNGFPERPTYALLFTTLSVQGILGGFGTSTLNLAVSNEAPPAVLGRMIGMVELSWGLASLLGFPAVGLLLSVSSRAFFFGLSVFSFAIVGLNVVLQPRLLKMMQGSPYQYEATLEDDKEQCRLNEDSQHSSVDSQEASDSVAAQNAFWPRDGDSASEVDLDAVSEPQAAQGTARAWLHSFCRREILAFVTLATAVSSTGGAFFIIIGSWMEDQFSLTTKQFAAVSIVVGVAELMSEACVTLVSDKLGAYRAIVLGSGTNILCYTCMIFVEHMSHVWEGALLIFLIVFFFEFAIVNTFAAAVYSEDPTLLSSRLKVAVTSVATGAGLSIGSLVGAVLWSQAQGVGIGLFGVCCNVLCVLMVFLNWNHFEMYDPTAAKASSELALQQVDVELKGMDEIDGEKVSAQTGDSSTESVLDISKAPDETA